MTGQREFNNESNETYDFRDCIVMGVRGVFNTPDTVVSCNNTYYWDNWALNNPAGNHRINCMIHANILLMLSASLILMTSAKQPSFL